jgi:hypothetical protein
MSATQARPTFELFGSIYRSGTVSTAAYHDNFLAPPILPSKEV